MGGMNEDEYTPSLDEVREAYILVRDTNDSDTDNGAEFDRWLTQHDADVRERTLSIIRNYEAEVERKRAEESQRLYGDTARNIPWIHPTEEGRDAAIAAVLEAGR